MITVLSYLVIIFGYIALFVFIFGLTYRILGWARLPTGFYWGLYPRPTKWTFSSVIWKIFALPTLFTTDKQLWIAAIFFHIVLFMSVALHFELLGVHFGPEATIDPIGACAGIIALIAVVYYIQRRLGITRSKEISALATHFWLWLLLVQVGIGTYLRAFDVVAPEVYSAFAISVLTFKPTLPPPDLWFLFHAFIGEMYLFYIVFGKPVHSIGQFFSQYILAKPERR